MHELMNRLSAIMRLLRMRAEQGGTSCGLGYPEQRVLMCLYPDKTSNQDAIAHMLDVDKGTIARTMTKLEDKGLIVRTPNPQDRRENMVSLAPASAAILDDMRVNLKECSELAFKGFSEKERAQTLDALERIANNLR